MATAQAPPTSEPSYADFLKSQQPTAAAPTTPPPTTGEPSYADFLQSQTHGAGGTWQPDPTTPGRVFVGGLRTAAKWAGGKVEEGAQKLADYSATPENAGSADDRLPIYAAPLPLDKGLYRGAGKDLAETMRGAGHILGAEGGPTDEQLRWNGAMEVTGAISSNLLQFLGGEEALKSMSLAEKLGKVTQLATFLEKFPEVGAALEKSGVLLRSTSGGRAIAEAAPAIARQSTVAGIQKTVQSGGDVKAGLEAAGGTALAGGVLSGVGGAAAEAVDANRALTENIGGVDTTITPEMRKAAIPTPQQAAGQEAISNAAGDTLRGNVEGLNASRAAAPAEATAGSTPYSFDLKSSEPGPPSYRTQVSKVPRHEPIPAMQTENADMARSHISKLNEVIDAPEFENRPASEQRQIKAARSDAQRQMSEYHETMRSTDPKFGRPQFQQVDVPSEVSASSYPEAADHVEGLALRGSNYMNDVTGGKFNNIVDSNKAAWRTLQAEMKAPSSAAKLEAAETAVDRSNQQMNDLLDKDLEGVLSPKEVKDFRDTYSASQDLRHVSTAVEGSFSGNPSESQRSWQYRGFDGTKLNANLRRLEGKYGYDSIARTVGPEQLKTLHEVADANVTLADRGKFGGVVDAVKTALKYGVRSGIGGTIGFHLAGPVGAAVGTGAEISSKLVVNKILSSPKASQYLLYGLKNGMKPEVLGRAIAPIITHAVPSDTQEQQQ